MNILVAPCFSGATAKHKLAKQALERLQEDCIITNHLSAFRFLLIFDKLYKSATQECLTGVITAG